MRWLVLLLAATAALALVATLTQSRIAGWLGVAALLGAVAAYVQWRRAVRREKY